MGKQVTDMLERVARALEPEVSDDRVMERARAAIRAVFEGQTILAAGCGVGGMTLDEYYFIDKAEVDAALSGT